jgi:ketosteroid isomerase-like protein
MTPARQPDAAAVRRYYAAWTARDLDTMLEIAHPDIEATPTLGLLYDRRVYRGHEGIADWAAETSRKWPRFEPEVLDTIEHEGRTIAFIRLTADSGHEGLDARFCVEHEFRDGRMRTLHGRDWHEVHEELGLEE